MARWTIEENPLASQGEGKEGFNSIETERRATRQSNSRRRPAPLRGSRFQSPKADLADLEFGADSEESARALAGARPGRETLAATDEP